tara:strand:- start:374 stop:1687 length:1314 start_codon:yes stop_codon:yes gene_type:complete
MDNIPTSLGSDMHDLLCGLFPICRSITGRGVRETLKIIQGKVPLTTHEVPSGTRCFDWVVPDEWNINDAYVKDKQGRRVIDFNESNLHVVNYSKPFEGELTLEELRERVFTHPHLANAIPYVTSYYKRTWGFCMRQSDFDRLGSGPFKAKIDSTLKPGVLNYGELLIPGETDQEILLASNICHPSMANNELAGPVLLTYLAKWLLESPSRRYSYRILWLPETIGAICYLSKHAEQLREQVIAGYQVVCTGGPGPLAYVQSRNGRALVDRVTTHVLHRFDHQYEIKPFRYRGSDERQWNSPGIDLPIGMLAKSKFEEYPEYHTSLDDLSFVRAEYLQTSFDAYARCLQALERNDYYQMLTPCEPKLDKLGLWNTVGGHTPTHADMTQLLFALIAYCDGEHDLIEIADMHDIPVWDFYPLVDQLVEGGILGASSEPAAA